MRQMSTRVVVKMFLMCVSNVLPKKELESCFLEVLNKTNCKVENDVLIFNNSKIGNISLTDRIVVKYTNERFTYKLNEVRDVLNKVLPGYIASYNNILEQDKIDIQKSNDVNILMRLRKIEIAQEEIKRKLDIQNKEEVDAMKNELIESAYSKGYVVEENSTNEGVELQFIKRQY